MPPRRTRPMNTPQRPRSDERGGAVSLMVILMTPAFALAAVAAAAVPQRLAAQAALDDSAAQLAAMAAHWRDAQNRPHGPVDWYYPDCTTHPANTPTPDPAAEPDPTSAGTPNEPADTPAAEPGLAALCETATRSLLAGLGAVGIDADRLAGYQTSSLATAAPAHDPAPVPCRTGAHTVTADAVHVGASAPWAATSWAPGQIWPDGISLQAHATATITRADSTTKLPDCTPLTGPAARLLADRAAANTAFGHPQAP